MKCESPSYYTNFWENSTGCYHGYNPYDVKCCNYGWILFGWTMLGVVGLMVLCCILKAMKRKKMQQAMMANQAQGMGMGGGAIVVQTQGANPYG